MNYITFLQNGRFAQLLWSYAIRWHLTCGYNRLQLFITTLYMCMQRSC